MTTNEVLCGYLLYSLSIADGTSKDYQSFILLEAFV